MAVSKHAAEIAHGLKNSGMCVDIESVEVGALLHDIGRCRSHGMDHGVKGAEILDEFPELRKYSRYCLTHIGAGLTNEEATELKLPPGDYLPESLEEKIVAYADNITVDDRKVDASVTLKKMGEYLGKEHPAVKRVKKLNGYMESLLNQ